MFSERIFMVFFYFSPQLSLLWDWKPSSTGSQDIQSPPPTDNKSNKAWTLHWAFSCLSDSWSISPCMAEIKNLDSSAFKKKWSLSAWNVLKVLVTERIHTCSLVKKLHAANIRSLRISELNIRNCRSFSNENFQPIYTQIYGKKWHYKCWV